MKSFIKISLLLALPFFVKAQTQQHTLDSLKEALLSASTDSSRYDITNRLVLFYYQSNRDSALQYSEIGLSIAEKNKMAINVAEMFGHKGYQLYQLKRFGGALKFLLRAIKIAQDPANENKVFTPGKYPDLRKKRLNILGAILQSLGHLKGATGDTTQLIVHYLKAIKIGEETSNYESIAMVKMNLGGVYFGLGKIDSALQLQQSAFDLMLKNENSKTYLGSVYRRLGDIYMKKGDKEKALEHWHQGVLWSDKNNNQGMLGIIYGNLTGFYFAEKNKDSSLYYAKKHLAVWQLMNSQPLEEAYANLSKSFELNGNKDSAYFYKDLALKSTEKTLKERIVNLGDFQKEAFKEQERLQQLEEEKIESKNKLRNYALLGVLGIFLIVGFFLYRNNRQKQKANKILQQQKDKVESTLHELKSTQSQLIQSEKMASLGELTAGIAHEIQNPLNFVNNFSEVNKELLVEMKDEIKKGNIDEVNALADDVISNEEKINHHGKRADAIVKGMLQHSSSSSGQKEPTNINALADEYLRLAYHGLRAKDKSFNATMKTDFDETIGNINIIPQDIGRVILNLITNAFYVVDEKKKAFAEKSSFENLTSLYEPTVSVSTKKVNEKVEITVQDNGNGIPKKILDKIFQPFFTTKPTGQGTGLGLSLSYDIVKAHGGELKVETKEGEGSEFIIQLPI